MMIQIVWDEPFLIILKKWKKKHPDLRAKFEDTTWQIFSEKWDKGVK
jgi:hypothetical protein